MYLAPVVRIGEIDAQQTLKRLMKPPLTKPYRIAKTIIVWVLVHTIQTATEMAIILVKTNCTLNVPILSARNPEPIRPNTDDAFRIEMR